jgi:hypothetical protein
MACGHYYSHFREANRFWLQRNFAFLFNAQARQFFIPCVQFIRLRHCHFLLYTQQQLPYYIYWEKQPRREDEKHSIWAFSQRAYKQRTVFKVYALLYLVYTLHIVSIKKCVKNEKCVVDLTGCAMIFELINTVLHDIIKVYTVEIHFEKAW